MRPWRKISQFLREISIMTFQVFVLCITCAQFDQYTGDICMFDFFCQNGTYIKLNVCIHLGCTCVLYWAFGSWVHPMWVISAINTIRYSENVRLKWNRFFYRINRLVTVLPSIITCLSLKWTKPFKNEFNSSQCQSFFDLWLLK